MTAAYIMTVTNLGWRDTLNSIRGMRSVANPNYGFQKQLQHYDSVMVQEVGHCTLQSTSGVLQIFHNAY